MKGDAMRHAYPFTMTPDEDGRLVVAFPDVRGASTDGADEAEAMANAADCLIAALIGYVTMGEPIPHPSPVRGRRTVRLPPLVIAKLALHSAMLEQGVAITDLAHRIERSEPQVRRLLDLDYRSDIGDIEAALGALGKRLDISVRDAA